MKAPVIIIDKSVPTTLLSAAIISLITGYQLFIIITFIISNTITN